MLACGNVGGRWKQSNKVNTDDKVKKESTTGDPRRRSAWIVVDIASRARGARCSQLGAVASKDNAGPLVGAMLARVTNPQLRLMDSSLKFCLLAEGKAEVYLGDLQAMEWDTAAAQCVAEAAGGGVYSLDGESLRYGKSALRDAASMTVGDTRFDWRRLVAQL